jgi:hypothetical protein
VEDHREWTFFIGNPNFIEPWWDKFPAKFVLSCVFLLGWPFRYLLDNPYVGTWTKKGHRDYFRLSYIGRVGKHVLEIKKAVFVEYSSQDEGVSLTATPGSNNNHNSNTANSKEPQEVGSVDKSSLKDSLDESDDFERIGVKNKPVTANNEPKTVNDR